MVQREVKKLSSIVKLDLVFVEGIICVGGWLYNLFIKKKVKYFVIFFKDYYVLEFIMYYYYLISGNFGFEYILFLIRQKYWII